MKQLEQRVYVLVHGAWFGGWAWRLVAPGLRALGHVVTEPTLTGLGERSHLANDSVDLETHILDVVGHIEMQGLYDVTLVGWSYGGAVITGVLARIPTRIRSMVYLDAFMPEDGTAVAEYMPPEVRRTARELATEHRPLPPLPLEFFGIEDPNIIRFVTPRLVPQPWRTLFQPVDAPVPRPRIPITHIVCRWPNSPFMAAVERLKADARIRVEEVDADHLLLLTSPAETIDLIDRAG